MILRPTSSSSPSSLIKFYCNNTTSFNLIPTNATIPFTKPNRLKPCKSSSIKSSSIKLPTPLNSIKPYVQSEWKTILKGWMCSAVSVYSLSRIVPRVGKFSASMDVSGLRREGLVISVLLLIRWVSNYLQQSLLWEASLRSVYKMRVFVFERVLQRDLGFFEGSSGNLAGDIAYRITAEASDVADTIYSLLNTIVPGSMQLLAMANQMLAVSPVLSLVSALVIPLLALVSAYFGEKLREISNKANLSIANLSAYLNEVFPSIFFVKANNAEQCECIRFQRLAYVDLYERLGKKKMKALVPQIVQVTFFGALLLIFIGSLVAASDLFDCSRAVSFMTSLVLLIEPIQTLFSGTVAENIGYRDLMTQIDMERVKLAARIANASEFIETLSEQYATNIGPRGSLLSGGQRQRLAIARALYQNPSILILDEATSALDTRSEMLVRQALQRLMENRTVIVIAHRLETVLMAERVFLLNDGKLQEISRASLLVAQQDSLASGQLLI